MKATQERERERGTRDVLEGEWDQQNNIQQREGDDTLSGCLLSGVKIICLGFRSGKLILQSDREI